MKLLKKIFIFMFMLSVLSVSANALTELTSCGKDSGWIENETYLINITEIPNDISTLPCFSLDGNLNNITFKGTNETIHVRRNLNFFEFKGTNGAWTKSNFTVKDLNINGTYSLFYMRRSEQYSSASSEFTSSIIDNVRYTGDHFLFSSGGTDGGSMFFTDSIITNSNIVTSDHVIETSGTYNVNQGFINTTFKDSVFISKNNNFMWDAGVSTLQNSTIDNCVLKGNKVILNTYTNDASPNVWNNSLVNGEIEYNNTINIINNRQYLKELFGVNWVGQINQSYLLMDGSQNTSIMLDGSGYGSPYTIDSTTKMDFSIEGMTADNFLPIILNPGSSTDCSYFYDSRCTFTNEITGFLTGTDTFYGRGMVNIKSDTSINNINFLQITSTGTGDNNANAISNTNDVTYDNVFVNDTSITWTDNVAGILVKVNNFELSNTGFNLIETGVNTTYAYAIDIDSNIKSSNEIHLNTFSSSTDPININISVFGDNCDTQFYNNYLANESIISETCTDVDATSYIGYKHTDNKIYYYNVGNYYEDNSNCTDSDNDGFCDNSYTSGAVTDTNPLSEYPFDYTQHLLTADTVVEESGFNINITSPIDNQTFQFNDLSTATIDLSFYHNSTYPDLVCSYVVDGSTILSIEVPENDTEYTTTITNLDAKNYTYRVECGNEFIYEISEEITFTVEDTSTTDNSDTTDGDTTTDNDTTFVGTGIDVFTGSIDDDTGNIQSLFTLLNKPVGFMLLIGVILFFVAGVYAIIALILLPIKSRK